MTGTEPPHSEEKIQLSDVIYFPLSLWLLILICVTFYIAVFLFTQFGGYVNCSINIGLLLKKNRNCVCEVIVGCYCHKQKMLS